MNDKIFFKVDVLAIRDGGLLSKIGADGWTTLCAIASFMDEKGECYPTQETLAVLMGVTRQAANARIGRLLKIKLEDGSPLLERHWIGYGLSKRSIYRINMACGVSMGRNRMSAEFDNARDSQCKDELLSNATKQDITAGNENGHKEEPYLLRRTIQEEPTSSDDIDLDKAWKELYKNISSQ